MIKSLYAGTSSSKGSYILMYANPHGPSKHCSQVLDPITTILGKKLQFT
jgi:hypothetical protein